MKLVIIGGVAGGASAAARARRLSEEAQIVLFERGGFVSFANCGLPYHIGGTIKERGDLLVQTPEGLRGRFNIDVRVFHEVTKIDRERKEVEVREVKTGNVYRERYDKIILSPGAEPVRPPLPGIDLPGIYTLRTIPDMDCIIHTIDHSKPRRAAVIGGGFIGLEMAENLHARGLGVSVVEMLDQVMPPLDKEMAEPVHQHLRLKGVFLRLDDGVAGFEKDGDATAVKLKSGAAVTADIVILAIGVAPETRLARECGLAIGERRGIRVDEYMQTSDPDIYAVGDAIEVKDYVLGNDTLIPLAGPANRQGRIAADNVFGRRERYAGTQGTAVCKVFDMTVALTGANEKSLKRANREYLTAYIHPNNHAGYYPGACPMTIKMLFAPGDGKVLGAQIVGFSGVDKRIDVLATAIRAGMTVYDLEQLELSYAPPYGSAKDPVNHLGFVASNMLRGDAWFVAPDAAMRAGGDSQTILDVRTKREADLGRVDGALHIPVDELRKRSGELPKDREIVTYCQVGIRSYIASRILSQMGFRVKNMSGGYKTFRQFFPGKGADEMNKKVADTGESAGAATDVKKQTAHIEVNACGMQCPGPIMKLKDAVDGMDDGQLLHIAASDPGFVPDAAAWCRTTGNRFVSADSKGGRFEVVVQKGPGAEVAASPAAGNGKTIIVFSGDLDKVMAAFIIANGAAAMGRPVTLFFTFWGLNAIRRAEPVAVKKGFMDAMFGRMMPRGAGRLSLSKMNMGGMGTAMMKMVMKDKNVSSLPELISSAQKEGVKLVACSMSMDVMGIRKEELIDGVEVGGVAAFLGTAEGANVNLFI
ncbi:MAG TPA: DsrE/DsrF/DrsH-like family protein [bacterium]|nr:DsrE/DsrF/DrsH-like family protein [bacterium]